LSESILTIESVENITEQSINLDVKKASEKYKITKKENATKISNHVHRISVLFIYGVALSIVIMIVVYVLSYYIESLKVMHSDIGGWIGNILSIMFGFMLSIIYDTTKD
jgi:cobalamin biosynthesis protein CobD/CbiB